MASKVRDKIVDAAARCFHDLGFNGCSIQDIVDKGGVPKGSFYNYFKTKEVLAVEVLELYAQGTRREMLADSSTPPVARLRGHFEFMASRYAAFGYSKGCLIGNFAAESSDHTPLVRAHLADSLVRWTEAVASAIREGQEDGSIVAGLDPVSTARFLINSWEGAVVRMKIANSREPLEDYFTIAFSLLVSRDKTAGTGNKPTRKAAA